MARKSTKKEDILDNKADETIVEATDEKKDVDEQLVETIEEEVATEPKVETPSDSAMEEVKDTENEPKKDEKPTVSTYHRSKTFGYSWNGVEMDF